MASVISVNVGRTRDVDWRGKKVTTAIWKEPVAGPVKVGRLGAEGDQQADRMGHGGEQRALFVYQVESYRYWQDFLGREEFVMGQFGENLTVSGMADDEVCVGDRYRVGGTVLEISQPRVTCYKVGIRLNDERMPALLVKHRRPGFYFRVIQEGVVSAGDGIQKLADGPGRMSVPTSTVFSTRRSIPSRSWIRCCASTPSALAGADPSRRCGTPPRSLRPAMSACLRLARRLRRPGRVSAR